ncbi:D-alanyl-D-alanine carboxypeptidase family protein, partial [Patescibacteria group bacterium]|nr:D-alanyl-D-alanine carboxypeptidase family protein [Patescibacteria group bacterium]
MKASPKLFLYLLLGAALILIVIISQSEKKPEESKEFRGMAAKEEGVAIAFEQADKLSIETSITAKKATEVSTGVITTEHGDELLVLINKNIRLPATYEPEDLVGIDGLVSTTRGGTTLRKEVAKALEKMAKEAKKESIVLTVLSAYRSYWNQQATFSFWVQQV